jgi:hypothetical protein
MAMSSTPRKVCGKPLSRICLLALILVAGWTHAAISPDLLRQAEACQRVVGDWRWFIGGIAHFSADGKVEWRAAPGSPHALSATWTCQPDTGDFTVTWQQGLVDSLHLSPDGRALSGQNDKGVSVSGERVVPGAAKPAAVAAIDPKLVGWWELEVQFMTLQGPVPVLWHIRPDGHYDIDAGSLSHSGTMTGRDGQWTLHATTSSFEDGGTYELADWATLVNHGKAGTGRWHRRDPGLTLRLTQVGADHIPEGVPEVAAAAARDAARWQPDAILQRVEFKPAQMNLGTRVTLRFGSSGSGNGLSLTVSPQGTSFFVLRGGGGTADAIPQGFLDLPQAWAVARQQGVPPPLGHASLQIWHPGGGEAVLAWSLASAQRNAPSAQIDGATGVVLEGDLSGYVAQYNAQWQQAIAGLRRLFARPASRHGGGGLHYGTGSGYASSGSGEAGTGGGTDDWARSTAMQNAWEAGDMGAYDRIQNGESTWEDQSNYGGD